MSFDQLGPYQIVRHLGKGGMGTVYEGVDPSTGERVAVKVLSAGGGRAEGFRDRFEAEIESLKKLRHDHIVKLYGYGEQEGHLYYAMELICGPTLEDALRKGKHFTWQEVTQIGIDLAKALKHAHDHGVIHRDIKPANLLQDAGGRVKLSDFGIARVFGGVHLTQAGGVLGTAEYMSPEQADARSVDHRCDQYSLGGVLYALLAGRPPFRAAGIAELIQLQRFAHPEPVRSFAPATPAELERIVMQLLEKDPDHRFRSTMVLARQLEAMQRALTRGQTGPPTTAGEPQQEPLAGPSAVIAETRLAVEGDSFGAESGVVLQGQRSLPMPSAADQGAGAPTPVTPEVDHFTPVDPVGLQEKVRPRHTSAVLGWHSVLLAGGLLVLAGGAWYFSRPLSADALYAKINAAVSARTDQSLLEVEEELNDFLRRFPADPRVAKLGEIADRAERIRMDRRLTGLAKRTRSAEKLSVAERIYVGAVRLEERHPEEAVRQLDALVALLEVGPADGAEPQRDSDRSEPSVLCLQLARQRLKRLRARVKMQAEPHIDLLRERLRRAAQLRESDVEEARRIWQAVVLLYQDKPWAAEYVAKARKSLASSAPNPEPEGEVAAED